MEHFRIDLNLDYEKFNLGGGHRAYMNCYIPSNYDFSEGRKRPAMIVCPGGGYGGLSPREAEPVAFQYVAADIATFVLYYSTAEDAGFPRCLFEALTAVKTIRENADEWNVDPDKIAISGFSAGGHLAASASAYWNSDLAATLGKNELFKINATVLSYPVITNNNYGHMGSFINLVGEDADAKTLKAVSIEKQVTEAFPPTFLWHTATDQLVPVENSLLMAQALSAKDITFELHVYPQGPHGMSLCDIRTAKVTHSHLCEKRPRRWIEDSITFLKEVVFVN